MSNTEIEKILKLHCIETRIENGHVFGTEVYTYRVNGAVCVGENVVDLTGWPRRRVYDWLGY